MSAAEFVPIEITKTMVCNWFLFWLCIMVALAISATVIFTFMMLKRNTIVAMSMLPTLFVFAISVANTYFVYAMCTKLPEGFVSGRA